MTTPATTPPCWPASTECTNGCTPVVAAAATPAAPAERLPTKLQPALDNVRAGETVWLTRPLIDSYHTVWFELHEELILAVGLTREEAASRARKLLLELLARGASPGNGA